MDNSTMIVKDLGSTLKETVIQPQWESYMCLLHILYTLYCTLYTMYCILRTVYCVWCECVTVPYLSASWCPTQSNCLSCFYVQVVTLAYLNVRAGRVSEGHILQFNRSYEEHEIDWDTCTWWHVEVYFSSCPRCNAPSTINMILQCYLISLSAI